MKRKRQHFVPQHYLRQFRVAGTSQVMATRIEPLKFIGPAAINRQCQADYFYGEDGSLEELLSQSETDLAPVLVRVSQRKAFDTKEEVALRWLAVVLRVRTRKAAEAAKVLPRRVALAIIKAGIKRGELPPPPCELTPEMMDFGGVPGHLLKHSALPSWMEMQTLHCTLLEAGTGNYFITSDNPVVMMNQLFAGTEPHRSFAGFSRSGFQLLLPISPKLCMFFYDQKVYNAGSRRASLVRVCTKDVEIINSLQVLTAEQCLYFHHADLENEVDRLVARFRSKRMPIKDLLHESAGGSPNETFLLMRNQGVMLPKLWTFCRYRKNMQVGPDKRRNPKWTALVDAVMKDMDQNPSGEEFGVRLKRVLAGTFQCADDENSTL